MKEPSSYLKRILPILNHPVIKPKIWHLVDFESEEIDWDALNYGVLSGGEKTAISWLYLLWSDSEPPADWRRLFEGFSNLAPEIQALLLRALAQRHGCLRELKALLV